MATPQTGRDLFELAVKDRPDDFLIAVTPQTPISDDRPCRQEYMLTKRDLVLAPPVKVLSATINTAILNVRDAPGLKSNAVAQLKRGEVLRVYETELALDSYTWLQIAEGDYAGRYVAKELLGFI